MLYQIPNVLTPEEVAECMKILQEATWTDGRDTANGAAAKVKKNNQIGPRNQTGQAAREIVMKAVQSNKRFHSVAFPYRFTLPMFNKHVSGDAYGFHYDTPMRVLHNGTRLRVDLSATIFLSQPDEYDGGGLIIQDTFGQHAFKLPAGHMVIYPAGSLHQVNEIKKGTRIAAVLWMQSTIHNNEDRAIMADLSEVLASLYEKNVDTPISLKMSGAYNNLIRRFSEV